MSAIALFLAASLSSHSIPVADPAWWPSEVEEALVKSGDNRAELTAALSKAPKAQRPGIAFLIANMPDRDLKSLKAAFLLENLDLAYQAREQYPWAKSVPEELFLNDVLPYASVSEKREDWRKSMRETCLPIVKDARTLTDAAQAVNAALFAKVNVKYSVLRGRPDQSPSESIKSGIASCTGLSILLIDACRSVGIPARAVGIPEWVNKKGNHTWVEVWDNGWHFTGACEHDPKGLDRGWFIADASLAQKNSVEHSIYASSFRRTKTTFPMIWDMKDKGVFAENVTDRYTAKSAVELKGLTEDQSRAIAVQSAKYFDQTPEERVTTSFDPSLDALLKTHSEEIRQVVWKAYAGSKIHVPLKSDFDKKEVSHDKYRSEYTVKTVGEKPAGGWGLVIAMHGGGNAPKSLNDSQWKHMQIYYKEHPEAGGYIYVALRAPNDTWNGFYDDYVCPLIENLIRQFVLYGEVDPDRVDIMGYSHGGYGAFYLGPKMPDRFAAIHASASAPTDGTISAKSLRNTYFAFMIGEKDTAYGRRERCEKFCAEVEELKKANPGDYPVTMEFQKGLGHGGLPDRDILKDLVKLQRNPVPKHVTWEPMDSFITDQFWVTVPKPAKGQLVDAQIAGNKIVVKADNVESITLWLDGRLVDASKPVEFVVNGKAETHSLDLKLKTLCKSILHRGDPRLAAAGRVDLNAKTK